MTPMTGDYEAAVRKCEKRGHHLVASDGSCVDCGYEAVQFGPLRPWHAVDQGTDRTLCGRSTLTAQRMWHSWAAESDRCKRCEAKAGTSA